MNVRLLAALAAFSLLLIAPAGAVAEYDGSPYMSADGAAGGSHPPRMIAGTEYGDELVATGAVDTITAPAEIVTEIGEDARNFGVGGLVTGGVRGGVQAAGQALQGGARMAIGILDILTSPFREPAVSRR